MARFALRNALAVVALLVCFPAGGQQLPALTRSDLLLPSVSPSSGRKIIGYACKEVLFMSAMSAATDIVGEVVTEGRGEAVKFIVHEIGEGVAAGACDALVEKTPTPELDPRKKFDGSLDRPPNVIASDPPTVAAKPLAQPLCSAGQFYNMNTRKCVDLEGTPNCPPTEVYFSGKCTDIASLAGPQCAPYQRYDIFTKQCVMRISTPDCPSAQFYSALEKQCVSLTASDSDRVSCRPEEHKVLDRCIPSPWR
jgi:hypothetical protein